MTRSINSDLENAVRILKEEGVSEIYLFGSIAEDKFKEDSDIDIAVRGVPDGEFFRLLGRLLFELDRPVDLVDLDKKDDFSEFLIKEGELVRAS